MQLKTRSSLKFPLFFLFSFSLLKLVTLYFSWRWKGKAFPLPHYCWGTASVGISDFPPRKAPGSWLAFQGPEWLSLLRDSKYSVLQYLPSYHCFQDQAYQIHKSTGGKVWNPGSVATAERTFLSRISFDAKSEKSIGMDASMVSKPVGTWRTAVKGKALNTCSTQGYG